MPSAHDPKPKNERAPIRPSTRTHDLAFSELSSHPVYLEAIISASQIEGTCRLPHILDHLRLAGVYVASSQKMSLLAPS